MSEKRFRIIISKACRWDSEERIHLFSNEEENLEGIYDNYEEVHAALERIAKERTPHLVVEVQEQLKSDYDGWVTPCTPPVDLLTTDPNGNLSEKETFHHPTAYQLAALNSKRFHVSMKQKRKRGLSK